jgi:peptide/nickel transport system substrate-binding protein
VLVEGMLEAVGFTVDVEAVSATSGEVIQRVIVDANYEIAAWGLGVRDASPWVTLYNNLASGIPSNYAGYSDPAMDAALADLKAATTPEEAAGPLAEIQEIWTETAPLAIYESSANVMYWRDGVEGIEFSQNIMMHFGNAYLDD